MTQLDTRRPQPPPGEAPRSDTRRTRATVYLQSERWPPAAIDMQALQGLLPSAGLDGNSAHAYQCTSEILVTFDFVQCPGIADDIQAELIAMGALAAVDDAPARVVRVRIAYADAPQACCEGAPDSTT
jgi:hypothetical protein